MKLKEYIENLNKFVEENPEVLNLDVVYSADDEGNCYQEVGFEPSTGFFDRDMERYCTEEHDCCPASLFTQCVIIN